MTLAEYTAAILPLIRAAQSLTKDRTISGRQLKYLYKQALYGYEEFGRKFASVTAQAKYERLKMPGRITQWEGHQQYKFDPNGKMKGLFHLDHVYTLSMLDRALRRISPDSLDVETVNRLVRENYAVAWITSAEDRKLTARKFRSKRGITLKDALSVYSQVGIDLIDTDG